jgi:hypothetical protein
VAPMLLAGLRTAIMHDDWPLTVGKRPKRKLALMQLDVPSGQRQLSRKIDPPPLDLPFKIASVLQAVAVLEQCPIFALRRCLSFYP